MYEILITMNSQRCWIVNIRAKILIVKRFFFMKSAKYCNLWLAIHGFWCTAYWMGSMYWYQCCHYSVFFNMVFFVLYIFVWMLYHKIIMWSNFEYINCCVCCYGDDETAIFFYFDILVFHILYIRWELIKKKKGKEVEMIHSHPLFQK